ncbi:Uncharacterized protein APZ42_006145 [Daphnia magna]|uniref:Uncharacterized protein n=1 Tax=Daphnia magna TaxID=35525 RepID=A0A164G2F7_9CRUS|nr:Uncharacterized protein APZ42_006145 [Daphnia magna]
MCDPMTYPLLFPNGDNGWDQNMIHSNPAISNRCQTNEDNSGKEDMTDREAQVVRDAAEDTGLDVVEP